MSNTITRDQYVKACVAFWDALGGNAREAYFPVHLDEDKITFSRTPAANGGHVRANTAGFGDAALSEVLSIVTTIKVVD
jgi:hypothetical protein